jgi:EAL domain-containing protein (putative c-di-GMP-specific phosphodiesterase class I)
VNTRAAVALLASKRIEERFTKDLDTNRFVLFFQSIASLTSKEDGGYREILIRFREEEQNMQSPGMFFPLLEEQGLLPALDRWIVGRVLKWIQECEAKLGPVSVPRCSVNLCSDTLREESAFAGYVMDEIRRTMKRAPALSFEILESDAIACTKSLTPLMLPLRSVGCTFALSGYTGSQKTFELASSLGFAFIKIDGSMLFGLTSDPAVRQKLNAVNRQCHGYGIRTVCMQVEDDATLGIVRDLGVDFAQGFGIERPRLLEFSRAVPS